MSKSDHFIPALSFKWLTPLYDPLLRWGMREDTLKRQLIKQAEIQPGHRILDLGCGTGTLTILIKKIHPNADVVGLDGDPEVLEIARTKAAKAGVEITLDHGMAFKLPYSDGAYDRVLTCLVMHHLTRDDKQSTLGEVYRVLRAGGELYILDFGKPRGVYGNLVSLLIKRLEQVVDNINGLLPIMMRRAGIEQVEEPCGFTTIFGTLSLYRGIKPCE